ncbi:hypothetical protein ACSYAD_36740, partial [Acaryochloris marina NIES-2412]|uniref:hypothetical protein n=1 Tax=Acaryochloris marina TaxID=155978 RepID=UPI00405990A3
QFTNKCFGTTREAKAWIRSKPGYEKATFKIAMNRRNYVKYAPPGAQLVCIKVYFEAAQRFQRCWIAVSV